MIRPSCGTMRGALAHQAAAEPFCGWCKDAERTAALDAERFPSRPARLGASLPAHDYQPVTAEQGARNAALLDAEVLAYEREWVTARKNRPAHLRVIPSAQDGAA